ncbi:MAG TPA: hypothetical protein VMW35_14350 [Myxococcota bacterium]|jgi:hypothetical protein|nr:hypothetical protein [Myxococcota bacterium]
MPRRAGIRALAASRRIALRLALATFVVVVVAVVAEGGARIALRAITGERAPVKVLDRAKHGVAAGDLAAAAPQAGAAEQLTAESVPHPFLGYVMRPRPVDAAWLALHGYPINEFGFIDDKSPLQTRGPGRLVVAVTGGSVSVFLANDPAKTLERELAKLPALAGREIVLVRLGLGGFKEPQQLATLSYLLALGGQFDVVVNLDGFNELALWPAENAPVHAFPAYPRGWPYQLDALASPERQRTFSAHTFLRETRSGFAEWMCGPRLDRSGLATLVWLAGDRFLEAQAATALAAFREASAQQPSSYAAIGPRTTFETEDAMLDALASLWERSSLQLHRLCTANGIRYVHVLQPNQYDDGSKPLAPEEQGIAIDPASPYAESIRLGYPKLRAAGQRLRDAGVDFVDLSGLFRSVEAPLYRDRCCHLNAEGTRRLAQAVAARVGETVAGK